MHPNMTDEAIEFCYNYKHEVSQFLFWIIIDIVDKQNTKSRKKQIYETHLL